MQPLNSLSQVKMTFQIQIPNKVLKLAYANFVKRLINRIRNNIKQQINKTQANNILKKIK